MITPKPLFEGAKVALLGASGPVEDAVWRKAAAAIETLGLRPRVYRTAFSRYGYLAGTDEARARDLNAAFADSEIDGILCVRGGYGANRIMPLLDWDMIAKNPKFFLGYSDVTALHIAMNQQCGFVTYHAPMPSVWGADMDGYSLKWLKSMLFGTPRGDYVNPENETPTRTLTGGTAKGVLCGGNLSLIAASLGTPWEIDTRGKILFIEEVGEKPYCVDRMLIQLRNSGKLAGCAGIVLGQFTRCETENPEKSLSLEQIFRDILLTSGKPVLMNLKCGHCSPSLSLPLGAVFELDAGACALREIG